VLTASVAATSTPSATPRAAVCGDGMQESGEECDDGNVVPGDGCSATCTLEPCSAAPAAGCRLPAPGKGVLATKGDATSRTDFGDPTASESYALCVYDAGRLLATIRMAAGGTCAARPCWSPTATGYRFRDGELTPDGASQLVLRAGDAGSARAQLKAKGANLALPPLDEIGGPVRVQLRQTSDAVCWEAVFGAPFATQDAARFVDRSD
jgi:cysteine-rich repeat protein